MAGEETAEKKLHDAASKGDVTTFQQLLQRDPDLLDRVSFAGSNRSPLHTATLQGNLEIVQEVLQRNPQLARELDSQKSSPLHIAAAQGYVEIASLLLSEAPNMCWWRDCHGMNPVHIAAINGHVEILKEMVEMDSFPAREKVDRGQTVLHLCVKHRQSKAFEVLVQNLRELVRVEDDDGDTVLHFATRYKQLEEMLDNDTKIMQFGQKMIKYLVEVIKIDKESRNSKGKTARQILEEIRRDETSRKIRKILRNKSIFQKGPIETLKKVKEVVMVVAILIVTMTFQAVVSPPGGVWQGDSSTHRAGEAVMASSRPKIFKNFVRANTVAFVSSLITLFLLTTGLSAVNIFFTMAAVYTMWVSLSSVAVSYGASVLVLTPNMETQSLTRIITIVVVVSVCIIGLNYVRAFIKTLKRIIPYYGHRPNS